MGRETFLLVFVLGAATLALWIAVRLPAVAPRSLRAATVHLAVALLLGFLLTPALRLVPGLPGTLSELVALFAVALPALTYMLLAGFWLLKVIASHPLARGR